MHSPPLKLFRVANYFTNQIYVKIRFVILIFWLQTDADRTLLAAKGSIPIGIGRDSHIKRAIIDKNARIGDNVKVIFILTTCYQLHCLLFQLSRRLTVLISSTLCVYSDHQHGHYFITYVKFRFITRNIYEKQQLKYVYLT